MQDQSKPPSGPQPVSPGDKPSTAPARPRRSWFATHGRDLRFLVVFGLLMGVYYVVTEAVPAVKERFFPWYLRFNADLSVGTLNTFGYNDVSRSGTYLKSSRGSVSVERGCDAAAPTALFAAAVLASPLPLLSKLPAVVVGALILAIVNVVRIITLFLSAAHWRAAFDILHLEVWQAAFIVLALVLWAVWATWATRRQRRLAHV